MKLKYDETWKGHQQVRLTLGIPEEALNIHGMVRDISIDDFKNEQGIIVGNIARTIDVENTTLARWTRLHESGLYTPDLYCPVTFTMNSVGKKDASTGRCALRGKDGADDVEADDDRNQSGSFVNNKVVDAVHISYNDHAGLTAREWEDIAMSNENRPREEREHEIKTDRTPEDVVGILVRAYEGGTLLLHKTKKNGEIEKTHQYVNERLKLLKKPENQWNGLRIALYRKLKLNEDLIVRTVSTGDAEHEVFKKDVHKLYPGKRILFHLFETGESIKYDIELTRKVLDAYHKGEPYDMVVGRIAKVGTIRSLKKGRERHKQFFTNSAYSFQQDLDRWNSEINKELEKLDIKWPEVKFEPQQENEIIEWYKKKDKLC